MKRQDQHVECHARIAEALAERDALLYRIERLAAAHAPKVDVRLGQADRHVGGSYADQTLVWCVSCRREWPCETYLWATGSKPFHVVIRPEKEPLTQWKAVTE